LVDYGQFVSSYEFVHVLQIAKIKARYLPTVLDIFVYSQEIFT